VTLLRQSPIFSPALFDFGGTIVGTTIYSDYITTNVLPALKAVNPSNFPVFMLYNVVLASRR
jgi:hypothetical protein